MALNDLIHVTAKLVTDGNEILMCRIINCLSRSKNQLLLKLVSYSVPYLSENRLNSGNLITVLHKNSGKLSSAP